MKNILIGAAAFFALPFSVQAGVLLPNTYARVYCESRAMGMDKNSSFTQAVSESYVREGKGMPVTFHGVETTSDVVAAIREARKRCPQYS